MEKAVLLYIWIVSIVIETCMGISSPLQRFAKYDHSIELQAKMAELWWTVNNVEQEITFELHVKTIGWVALGISTAEGMKGADMAVGWVDSFGKVHLQDRYAFNKAKPIVDNTTQDWFVLQGKEQHGWTAIQFKRFFDSCDPMDVPIQSGTNTIIFAYGLVDIDPCQSNGDITYHGQRRGTRMIPLRSYIDQPTDELMIDYDSIDFRLDNAVVPSKDTTYYCKVFKTPSRLTGKRHAIGHKVLIDSRNVDLVHNLDLHECDLKVIFNDDDLPNDICDHIAPKIRQMCSVNYATTWSVGGSSITLYPEEVGYPVNLEAGARYFMITVHFNNPQLSPNLRDSSGVRFYLSNKLRPHDVSYLVFGTASIPAALAIPPKSEQFVVDSYCPPEATRYLPISGINIISATPHANLQGVSMWTKLIRNNTVIDYLFKAESYNFHYQFQNRLPTPIKVYPGDSFVTRCIYNTKNKNEITLGGPRTADEMCLHYFSYYPSTDGLSSCVTAIDDTAWQTISNQTLLLTGDPLKQWLLSLSWTPESISQWQEFYNNASRISVYGIQGQYEATIVPANPKYEHLTSIPCKNKGHQQDDGFSCGLLYNSAK